MSPKQSINSKTTQLDQIHSQDSQPVLFFFLFFKMILKITFQALAIKGMSATAHYSSNRTEQQTGE